MTAEAMTNPIRFYDTIITSSDYNPQINSDITVTVRCVSRYDGSAVTNENIIITCTGGTFTKYNGTTITAAQTYSGTTNQNGEFTLTYHCSEWGLHMFSTNTHNSTKILVGGNPYPVGSIYISINSTSPSSLFGGTWVQIKDNFLLSAGDNYDNGDTGGSADAVVVSHNHEQNPHSHDAYYSAFVESNQNLGVTEKWNVTHTAGSSGLVYSNLNPTLQRSTHTASTTATNKPFGVDGTGKNMPPYLVVYMWKRTG